MSTPAHKTPILLIASDNANDAALVEQLLGDQFGKVITSTNPDNAAKDFDHQQPDVLVLVFNDLEKSERHYLGLYRLSENIHRQPHRTIILCNKDEVRRAYAFCRDGLFDDYVLFWPVTQDAPRLLMVVHHALRELAALKAGGPTLADFAAQARRLAELETLLDRQMAQGGHHIEEASRAMEQAEQEIGATLDGFSQRLIQGALPDAIMVKNASELESEIRRLKREEIQQQFHTAAQSVQPLRQWAHEFKRECAPHMESVRALNAMAERIRPTVLVVDDDELQRKMIGQILEAENYSLVFAANGIEALSALRKMRPDVILMDVMMPDIDGVEVTRRLKAVPRFADIPVIMITGNSEKNVVAVTLKLGAADFVVKPFVREVLIAKVANALGKKESSPAQ